MPRKTTSGEVSLPAFTNLMIGSYVFPRNPSSIVISYPKRNSIKVVLGGDIAEIEEMGQGVVSINLGVTLKTDEEVEDFIAAIRKPGRKRFYVTATRFYYVYGATPSFPREAMSPVAKRCSATLVCVDPFRYAHAETSQTDAITATGQQVFMDNDGGVYVEPVFQLTASESINTVTISDGTRTIAYTSTLVDGDILIFNRDLSLTKNGADATANLTITNGYPKLEAGETGEISVTFGTGALSSLVTTFRKRWWS